MPSWPSMSRITLGAVHSAILNCPAHTWFVIFYYSDGEYMHAQLYTTIDTTSLHRPVHINLVHVSRPVPLPVVHLDFHQLRHATTTTPHCALVKLSQLPPHSPFDHCLHQVPKLASVSSILGLCNLTGYGRCHVTTLTCLHASSSCASGQKSG
jgi:hypothetical protein